MNTLTDRATVLFLQNLTERGIKAGMAYPSWADGKPVVVVKEDELPTKEVKASWEEALGEARL